MSFRRSILGAEKRQYTSLVCGAFFKAPTIALYQVKSSIRSLRKPGEDLFVASLPIATMLHLRKIQKDRVWGELNEGGNREYGRSVESIKRAEYPLLQGCHLFSSSGLRIDSDREG